jgi:hypothetical protein
VAWLRVSGSQGAALAPARTAVPPAASVRAASGFDFGPNPRLAETALTSKDPTARGRARQVAERPASPDELTQRRERRPGQLRGRTQARRRCRLPGSLLDQWPSPPRRSGAPAASRGAIASSCSSRSGSPSARRGMSRCPSRAPAPAIEIRKALRLFAGLRRDQTVVECDGYAGKTRLPSITRPSARWSSAPDPGASRHGRPPSSS